MTLPFCGGSKKREINPSFAKKFKIFWRLLEQSTESQIKYYVTSYMYDS